MDSYIIFASNLTTFLGQFAPFTIYEGTLSYRNGEIWAVTPKVLNMLYHWFMMIEFVSLIVF